MPGVGEKGGRVGEGILEERVFLLKFAKDFRRQRWAEGDRRCTWGKNYPGVGNWGGCWERHGRQSSLWRRRKRLEAV